MVSQFGVNMGLPGIQDADLFLGDKQMTHWNRLSKSWEETGPVVIELLGTFRCTSRANGSAEVMRTGPSWQPCIARRRPKMTRPDFQGPGGFGGVTSEELFVVGRFRIFRNCHVLLHTYDVYECGRWCWFVSHLHVRRRRRRMVKTARKRRRRTRKRMKMAKRKNRKRAERERGKMIWSLSCRDSAESAW